MAFHFHLLWRHLRQYPGRTLLALFALAMAATFMLALAGLGAALRFRVGSHLEQLFPEERLQLEAIRGGIGPIAFESKPITDQTIQQLRAREEVAEVWPVEAIRFPVRVEGEVFNQYITSEAVIHGVPRALVADALKPDQAWEPPPTPAGPYPVVVSRYFLDLYNLGLARSSGLPLLSPSFVLGRNMNIVLGESTIGLGAKIQQSRTLKSEIVGLGSQSGMLGLALPAECVREFNKEFAPDGPAQYVMLVVQLRAGANRNRLLQHATELGLALSGGDIVGERIKTGVRIAGWALLALAGGVFALGVLAFYQLFAMVFHARRLDLVRLLAFGVTPRGALGLALGEVGAPALVAILIACLINGTAAHWLAATLTPMLAGVGSLPANLLAVRWDWMGAIALLILVASLLPALPMLRWVLHVEPGQAIRDM